MNLRNKITFSLITLIALVILPVRSFSQKLSAQVSKNKVVTGEVFQVSFTANGNMTGATVDVSGGMLMR